MVENYMQRLDVYERAVSDLASRDDRSIEGYFCDNEWDDVKKDICDALKKAGIHDDIISTFKHGENDEIYNAALKVFINKCDASKEP